MSFKFTVQENSSEIKQVTHNLICSQEVHCRYFVFTLFQSLVLTLLEVLNYLFSNKYLKDYWGWQVSSIVQVLTCKTNPSFKFKFG